MNMIQVAQHVDDLTRAQIFYTRLLGQEPAGVFDPPGLLFYRLDGVRLLLDRAAPTALLYLAVPDVGQTVERLRAEGVTIQAEPHVIFSHRNDALGPAGTDEWMAFITDSEDNTVGLVSY